jgi:hypothetical protein
MVAVWQLDQKDIAASHWFLIGEQRHALICCLSVDARCELFTWVFSEIRNPKGHNDPTIAETLVVVEELMTAGFSRRIVDNA